MAKMQLRRVRRTAVAKDNFRLVATKVNGEEVTLSTPIVKVNREPAFRKAGGRVAPVEQYGFQVGKQEVERFDAAAALVLKRHNAVIVDGANVPAYIARAIGREPTATAE